MTTEQDEARARKAKALMKAYYALGKPDMRSGMNRIRVVQRARVKKPSAQTWQDFADGVLMMEAVGDNEKETP